MNLSLRHTKLAGAGLVHLKGMAKLARLDLCYTQVTDVGFGESKRVDAFTRLLQLADTLITGCRLGEPERLDANCVNSFSLKQG